MWTQTPAEAPGISHLNNGHRVWGALRVNSAGGGVRASVALSDALTEKSFCNFTKGQLYILVTN